MSNHDGNLATDGETRFDDVTVWVDGLGGLCMRVLRGAHAGDWRLRDDARVVVDGAVLYRLEGRDSGETIDLTVSEAPWLDAPARPVPACERCGGPTGPLGCGPYACV